MENHIESIKMVNGEIWKPVIGYEGFYEISNMGRVKRLSTTVSTKNRFGFMRRTTKERIHKYHVNDRGMPRVELSAYGVQKIFSMSRLVAVAFIPNPNNLPCVCHKDDNPLNNIWTNLFWGTHKDNIDDKCRKQRQARGETNGMVKLKTIDVIEIRKLYNYLSYATSEIGNMYNVTPECISLIVKRKTWKHIA